MLKSVTHVLSTHLSSHSLLLFVFIPSSSLSLSSSSLLCCIAERSCENASESERDAVLASAVQAALFVPKTWFIPLCIAISFIHQEYLLISVVFCLVLRYFCLWVCVCVCVCV